jgi:hypothetical protein
VKVGKSKTPMGEFYVLLATKSQPDQVDGSTRSEEQPPEEEVVVGVEPVVKAEADSTPDKKTGDQVPHNRPEGALFII